MLSEPQLNEQLRAVTRGDLGVRFAGARDAGNDPNKSYPTGVTIHSPLFVLVSDEATTCSICLETLRRKYKGNPSLVVS